MKIKLLLISNVVFISACGQYMKPQYVEIQPNESAYVIPLEGATSSQDKFDSAEYLEKKKVASKRIYLPQKKISTGRMWFSYKWVPTARVITVNRAPVTFEWDGKQGIEVESRDSIGFSIGTNISAAIKEADTSKFLYNYPSGNLSRVLGKIVKSKATELLSREFAKYDLPSGREKKGEIVDKVKKQLTDFFSKSGVSIYTFGLTGGLTYEDKEVQEAINNNFKSELEIRNKRNEKLAQAETNQKNIDIAVADRKAAEQFAKAAQARTQQVQLEIQRINAEANLTRAKKWKGDLPANMIPENSSFLFNVK